MDKKDDVIAKVNNKVSGGFSSQVIILGTSHIAKESVEKIKKAFEENNPSIVCVELDSNRLKSLLSSTKKRKFSLNMLSRLGFTGWLFGIIGSYIQKKLGKYVGLEPGADMLTAVKLSQEKGIRVALIDRDIEFTLRRLSEEFTFKEKFRFFIDAIKGMFSPRKELESLGLRNLDLSKVPEKEIIEKVIKRIKQRYPGLYKSLVYERNLYMFNNIIKIAATNPNQKILVIVGAGHESGLKELFDKHSS